ncbi:twitchin-like protein, partial [Leptotrombidium deliense]
MLRKCRVYTVDVVQSMLSLKKESANNYDAVLEIKDVAVEDAGKYKVIAKNELGESNASINLNFDSNDMSGSAKPTFTDKPVIRQTDDGKVIFECRFVADPKATVQWFHKGNLVKEDTRHKYVLNVDKHNHVAMLEVSKVAAEDGGEYKCTAKNTHGENSATLNLNIDGGKPKIPSARAPRFPKKPQIKQGDSDVLTIECICESNPAPEITWYHGDKIVKESSHFKMTKKETGKDTFTVCLLIDDPQLEDGGTYRCHASNENGESNANIALNFEGDEDEDPVPEFVTKPKIIPKDGGALIILETRVKSTTKLTTAWSKGTTAIKDSSRIKSSIVSEGSDEYTIRLEIKDTTKEDGGTYKCNIKNEYGDINGTWNLNLEQGIGEPPSFVEKPKINFEQSGKLVVMEVKVRSKTNISAVWSYEGNVVKESQR